MHETLKNCPFCGAAAHFEMDEGRWEWVECESCGMQGNRSASLMEDCKPKLAEEWNRRTPQPTQAQAGAVPQYRLLQPGVDRIEDDDEFLSDDTTTWAIDPNGIFSGNIYGGHVLRPARRRIKGGQHGTD